jgi:peptidyl-prolyl cis-trans isomerase C
MRRTLALLALALFAGAAFGAPSAGTAFDTLYQYLGEGNHAAAQSLIARLESQAKKPADRFAAALEHGDLLLDKLSDYAGAEAIYARLADENPRHKQLPDIIYRLALAQELQEKYLDAARNYEKVATRYSTSTFGTDALDAIERCFRKNYQERVAVVDGHPLTRIEIDDRISRDPVRYETYDKKLQLLDSMVDTRLFYVAALAAGADRDPLFSASYREIRNRAVFTEWYERTVNEAAVPTEKEVNAAYRRDLAKLYTVPEKVHGWQLLVADKPTADSLRRLLVADPALAWDSLARTNSLAPDKERGGDMGLFARGVQPKEIEGAAFRLPVGQVSQPIKTADGFVLLRVTEKLPKSVRTLDEVRGQISAAMRQANTARLFDEAIAALKGRASIVTDSFALAQDKETLAVVNGSLVSRDDVEERVNSVPPMFRAQMDSPEGRQRILDQLILERLLATEVERQKLWLCNRVMDQLLTRRAALLVDTYRRMMTTDRVQLDSVELQADYQATIGDFKEPARVHAREITLPTRERAEQVRAWAAAGRLPAMIHGRALLVPAPEGRAELVTAFSSGSVAAVESLVSLHALQSRHLPRLTVVQTGGKDLPDLAVKTRLAGPYQAGSSAYGLAFADLLRTDRLLRPEPVEVTTVEELRGIVGQTLDPARDSLLTGSHLRLQNPLPASLVTGLFGDALDAPARQITTPAGLLLAKVTKRDSAQKATFADIARRFSTSTTRWSGGDIYWIARDDKAHDAKLTRAAFATTRGGVSPVIKLNDSAYVVLTIEDRKDAYTRPFAEVRPKIENKLRRNREAALLDALRADLRKAAKVEVLMKETDFAIEPLPEESQPIPAAGDR